MYIVLPGRFSVKAEDGLGGQGLVVRHALVEVVHACSIWKVIFISFSSNSIIDKPP